jgi:hypothetical protein
MRVARESAKFACEPRFGEAKIAHDGWGGCTEYFGCFFESQAGEIPEFNGLGLPRVEFLESAQRLVERQERRGIGSRRSAGVSELGWVKVHANVVATAFFSIPLLRVIDEYAAHRGRCYCEEVCAILPVCRRSVNEPKICFMDQSRRIEGVVRPFRAQPRARDVPQLIVNVWQERIEGFVITVTPATEKAREIRLVGWKRHLLTG